MIRFIALMALTASLPAYAGFGVSSFDKNAGRLGKNYFNVGSALDSNMETAWRVDPEQPNKGSWIEIDVPAATVDSISLVIGWAKNEKTFKDYARVKAARVTIYTLSASGPTQVAEAEVKFKDEMGVQKVALPPTKVGTEFAGGRIRITITDVYAGVDYPALAVSEAMVHLKEFPVKTVEIDQPPSSEVADHDGFSLVDGDAKSFWAAEGTTATMAFRASGFGLSSVGIVPGPKAFARPKKVKLTANNAEIIHELKDEPGKEQWMLLPAMVGFSGGAWGSIGVEILESYPPEKEGNGVAITEIKMMAGSIEDI